MRKCFRCRENEVESGWCKLCKKEYSQIYRSNHRKAPPKGQLRGNYRRAEKDFDLPNVTTTYRDTKGGVLDGCKEKMSFLGTRETSEGREDQWYCFRCKETNFIPHAIYHRLQVIRPDRERNPVPSGGNRADVLDLGVQGAVS